MSSSSGYFSSSSAAAAAAAAQATAPAAATEAAAAVANTDNLIAELAELQELQSFIATAPSPAAAAAAVNTEMIAGGGGSGGSSVALSEAAHVPKLPSTANRFYGLEVGSEGIFVHGLPSSATESGFRAFICLGTNPPFIPSCLGIKPAADLDALYHSVFLQVTRSPNEMFGCWAEDEAKDEGRGADGRTRLRFNRKTLRIRLGEYLALLKLVREEQKTLEARLLATARQLNDQDQLVPYHPPLVSFCGVGTGTFRSDVGNRLFFFAHLESRQAAIAAGIQTRLELREGGQTRVLEIPYGTLLRLATESHPFLADLLENWHHNAVNQLRLFAANEEVEKERRDSSSRSRSPQRSSSLVRGNVLDIDLMDVAAAAATAAATASASAAAIPAASMRDKTGGGGTNGSCSLSAQVKTLQLSSRSQQQQHQPPRHHTSPGKKLRDDPRKRKRSDSHHRGGNGSHHSHSK